MDNNDEVDQNLEPKGDLEEAQLEFTSIPLAELDMYLVGGDLQKSLVGYVHGGMTDKEIEEYIRVQRVLAPPSARDRNRSPSQCLLDPPSPPRSRSTVEATVDKEGAKDIHMDEASPSKVPGIALPTASNASENLAAEVDRPVLDDTLL